VDLHTWGVWEGSGRGSGLVSLVVLVFLLLLLTLGLLHWHLHYTAMYGMGRTRNTSKGYLWGLVVCVRAFAQLLVALCG
jgi:hypothetical protein